MKIGQAAHASGVSPRSLRFYEDMGLIVPGRCANGYRDYCTTTLDRVVVIRSLLESGLPVRLIKGALPRNPLDPAGAELAARAEIRQEVEAYRDRLAARIAALTTQHAALEQYLCAADDVECHRT
ncbi:MerR family transcriptional regulator [Luteipulveratus mongoliensis]|uniref:MerR family transcriptional regulator n=1 Tax=Luteipulveratus mongoliensis TaxID=571913 RepID=A0A0K1JKM9_9MICO|nr:MerR family transcriptional regulator [Luteipulveratus mongoliensis]